MKQSKSTVDARRDKIFLELLRNESINVIELANRFKVSELTIRRDLLFFEQKSLIERFYGGARVLNYQSTLNPRKNFSLIKHSIAKKAAEFCRHLLTEILRKPVTTVMSLCTMR